jgi:hypothetical protein
VPVPLYDKSHYGKLHLEIRDEHQLNYGNAMRVMECLWSFWIRGTLSERAAYVIGAVLMATGVVHVLVLIFSGETWLGPLSLRKPATFGLSFGLTLITVAWVSTFLDISQRSRTMLLTLLAAACVFETALVSLQAWRGVPSHFNVETRLDSLVARVLAGGGFVLVALVVTLTVIAFRRGAALPPSFRAAIQIGFLALLGAQLAGAIMIARGMTLVFQGKPQAAYATAGMLKTTHAIAMHGILVLPLLAWLLSFTSWEERQRLRLVLFGAAGYLIITGVAIMQDIRAVSLWELPPMMASIFASGMVCVLIAFGFALRRILTAPAPGGAACVTRDLAEH